MGAAILFQGRRRPGRSGLSLIEVMLAISVLAIGVSSVFAHYVTLYQMRGSTKNMSQVQDVLRSVLERVIAADGAILNTSPPDFRGYVYEWSVPRYEDFIDVAPLDGDDDLGRGEYFPPMTEADLLNPLFGPIINEPVGIDNLRVYVEYYRGEDDNNGTPGFLGDDLPGMIQPGAINDPGEFATRFADLTIRDDCRLDPDFPPLQQVPFNQTVLIRILVVADNRRAEVFTAKRNLPVTEE